MKSTSTNVLRILVPTAVSASIWLTVFGVNVLEDTSMHDALATLTNANQILASTEEVVKMALTSSFVTAYRDTVGNNAKLISMNAHRIHASMAVSVGTISPRMFVNVCLDIRESIARPTLMTVR